MEKVDVVIIGGGPGGLSAYLYMLRSNYNTVLLNNGAPGGKLVSLAEVENYPGLDKMAGWEMAGHFVKSVENLGGKLTYGNVINVSKEGDNFIVLTDDKRYESKVVIVGTGLTHVPTIKGEKNMLGKGVSYCATCDGMFFRNKVITVYGNNDRAVEEAIYLAPLSSELNFIIDGEFKGSNTLLERLKSLESVKIHENCEVIEILGDEHVEGVKVNKGDENSEFVIDTYAFFPLNGAKSAAGFLSSLDVELERGFVITNQLMQTNVTGLYAIGDCRKTDLRQIVTAASDGAIAATSAIKYLGKLKK